MAQVQERNCGLCGASTNGRTGGFGWVISVIKRTSSMKRKLLHGKNSMKDLAMLNANIRRNYPGQSVNYCRNCQLCDFSCTKIHFTVIIVTYILTLYLHIIRI